MEVKMLCRRAKQTVEIRRSASNLDEAVQHVAASIQGIVIARRGLRPTQHASYVDDDKARNNASTPSYQLASLSKQYTAYMCRNILTTAGLSIDQEVSIVSRLECTFRDLLMHRSPFRDLAHHFGRRRWGKTGDPTRSSHVLDHLEHMHSGQMAPAQGTYGNTSYVVIAALLERLTGRNFDDLFDDVVRSPLRMSPSTRCWDTSEEDPFPERAPETGKFRRERTLPLYDGLRGDGNVYSTVDDLVKWVTMWSSARADQKSPDHEHFVSDVPFADDAAMQYGMGWLLRSDGTCWHDGSWLSSRSLHVSFPSGSAMLLATNHPLDTLAEFAAELRPFVELKP